MPFLIGSTVAFVAACGSSSGSDSSTSSTSCTPAAGSDGCASAPVSLTLGSNHGGKVAANGKSYYTFTPSAAGVFQVSLTGQSSELKGVVMTNSFGTTVDTCDDFATSHQQVCAFALSAIPYGVLVQEMDGVANTFSVGVTALPAGSHASQGNAGSPVALGTTPPLATTLTVGPNSSSYYSFTPASGGYVQMSLSGTQTLLHMKSYNSGYSATTGLFNCAGSASIDSAVCTGNATGTIYLKIDETNGISDSFNINIVASDANHINETGVSLTVGGLGHGATIAPLGTSAYSFVATGASHTIALTSLPAPMNIQLTNGPGTLCTPASTSATTQSCIVNGLTASSTYTFQVIERGGVGGVFTVNVN